MNSDELFSLTIKQTLKILERKELSTVELTQTYLERIDHYNDKLNCFITIDSERALDSARQAEQRINVAQGDIKPGKAPNSLLGIPIALKDLYETQAVRTSHGSKFYADYYPKKDAEVVTKLKNAGAIILGKNNMHEIALGVTNVNPHFGASRNPWDTERITGGSSGGSACAVASGLSIAAMGSDTGGSIRIPASLCGVVGLKPTYGRVSLSGVLPLSWSLDHAGPIASNVQDIALMLQVIAGFDYNDPCSVDITVDDYLSNLFCGVKNWKVAVATGDFFKQTSMEVEQALQQAALVFEDLGAIVDLVEIPGVYEAAKANGKMVVSEAAVVHQNHLQDKPQDFGKDVFERLQQGKLLPINEYISARRTQAEKKRAFELFFNNYDILLTPTTVITAPYIEDQDAVAQAASLTRYTAPFNTTGFPAISLPCGFDSNHLPIGLQIISKAWSEAKLLRAAYAYEQAANWHSVKPKL